MRSICSERAFTLLALAVLGTGCTTTLNVRRGELVRSSSANETSTELERRISVEDDVALLSILQQQCTDVTREYRQIEEQEVKTFSTSGLVVSSIAVVAGLGTMAGLAYFGVLDEAESTLETVMMLYWPGAAAAIGLGGLIYNLIPDVETREVEAATTELETKNECRRVSVASAGDYAWSASLGSATREGRTGASGRLELRALYAELLKANDFSALQSAAAPPGFRYELRLADAPKFDGALELSQLSRTDLAEWAGRYDRELKGPALARWQNCRMLTDSPRETLACHFRF